MSVRDIELPNYKLRHELFNSISHGLGSVFGIIIFILCMLKINGVFIPNTLHLTSLVDKIYANISVSIYFLGIITCMTMSCIYHALKKNNGKRVFRVLDHSFIFLIVAGTYTPYCLITLREASFYSIPHSNFAGWILLAIVWILCILGIVFNSINIKKFAAFSMVMYIVSGWSILLFVYEIYSLLEFNGFMLLLFGGISFSIGAILYGLGAKKSVWWHTVFHFFVLFGVILQGLSIYLYVL